MGVLERASGRANNVMGAPGPGRLHTGPHHGGTRVGAVGLSRLGGLPGGRTKIAKPAGGRSDLARPQGDQRRHRHDSADSQDPTNCTVCFHG